MIAVVLLSLKDVDDWQELVIFSFLFLSTEDEESVLIKPRARSTASGKKLPAGAVSIFGGVLTISLYKVGGGNRGFKPPASCSL